MFFDEAKNLLRFYCFLFFHQSFFPSSLRFFSYTKRCFQCFLCFRGLKTPRKAILIVVELEIWDFKYETTISRLTSCSSSSGEQTHSLPDEYMMSVALWMAIIRLPTDVILTQVGERARFIGFWTNWRWTEQAGQDVVGWLLMKIRDEPSFTPSSVVFTPLDGWGYSSSALATVLASDGFSTSNHCSYYPLIWFFPLFTKRFVQLLVLYGLFFEFVSILFRALFWGENVWIINMFKKLATWKFESILFIIFVLVSIVIVLKPHKREITDKSGGNGVSRITAGNSNNDSCAKKFPF